MKTEIDFLRVLEADLDRAAQVGPPRAPGARLRIFNRQPSRHALVVAVAALAMVAGTAGFFIRALDRNDLNPYADAGGTLNPGPTAGGFPRFRDAPAVGSQKPPGKPPPSPAAGGSRIPLVGPQIVKTGQLSIEVPQGHFDEAFRQASLVASKYGGFVDSSSSRGSESKAGTLEIRVPSLSFDRAVGDLASLGTVLSQSVDATDVTAQYVDLQARVRTWQAQEDVLIKLMAEATTVQGTLRVQNELQDVQLQIERVQGQLRVLDDQTANGTISMSLREAGAPVTKPEQKSSWLPSFRNAWHDAVRGLLSFLFAVMVGLAYLVPAALLVLLGWLGYRQVRLRASV